MNPKYDFLLRKVLASVALAAVCSPLRARAEVNTGANEKGQATLAPEKKHTAEPTGDVAKSPTNEPVRDGEHRLIWPGRKLHWADYVLTGTFLAGALIVDNATRTAKEPRWTGGILFDDAVEKALIAETLEGREKAQSVSGTLTLIPQIGALADSTIVPLLFDKLNWRVAWQMSVLNVQAMSLNGLLSRAGHRGIARERPDVRYCAEDPEFSDRCGKGSNSSFPSGHTSSAFVGAGLVCAHHLHLPLYGHKIADVAACATHLGLATSAGILRVTNGRHYISDVIVGAAVGFGSGFVLPTFLYYRWKPRPNETARWLVLPTATTQSIGLGVVGIY